MKTATRESKYTEDERNIKIIILLGLVWQLVLVNRISS